MLFFLTGGYGSLPCLHACKHGTPQATTRTTQSGKSVEVQALDALLHHDIYPQRIVVYMKNEICGGRTSSSGLKV